MPEDAPAACDAVVWCRPDQVGLVRAVRERTGIRILSAGCTESARTGAVAGELGAETAGDLRASLASTDAGLVMIADPGGFGAGGADEDVSAINAARARGARVVSLEPIPADALELAGSAWTREGRAVDAVRLVNAPRRTPAIRELTNVRESFGEVRAMTVEVGIPALAGSLGAALVGAIDLVLIFAGEPETIDATLVGAAPERPGGVRGARGDLTALARFPRGQGATILASDRVASWSCRVTIAGEGGVVRADERGLTWHDVEGAPVDEHRVADPERAGDAVAVVADQVARVVDPASPEDAPIDLARALACAHAALLSARTGQPESPLALTGALSR